MAEIDISQLKGISRNKMYNRSYPNIITKQKKQKSRTDLIK